MIALVLGFGVYLLTADTHTLHVGNTHTHIRTSLVPTLTVSHSRLKTYICISTRMQNKGRLFFYTTPMCKRRVLTLRRQLKTHLTCEGGFMVAYTSETCTREAHARPELIPEQNHRTADAGLRSGLALVSWLDRQCHWTRPPIPDQSALFFEMLRV